MFSVCKEPDEGEKDLPVKTISFQPDGEGFTQFYTNDPANYDHSFRRTVTNPKNDNTWEIECKKISGYKNMGYGMIFGKDIDNHYNINIADGSFSIRKRVNGDIVTPIIKSWTASLHLYIGYDQINRIKAVKSDSTYTIYFNDQEICDFTDSDVAGNIIGFLASVGNEEEESFPNSPVDIRFRLP